MNVLWERKDTNVHCIPHTNTNFLVNDLSLFATRHGVACEMQFLGHVHECPCANSLLCFLSPIL